MTNQADTQAVHDVAGDVLEKMRQAGMTTATKEVEEKQEFIRKMAIAYRHFRVNTVEQINTFQEKLKKETFKQTGTPGRDLTHHYDTLRFIPLQDYAAVPPAECLDKIIKAKEKKCFDQFVVAKVEGAREYKDPIIYGNINGCPDLFFITQYNDDVKVEDIFLGDVSNVKRTGQG